MTLCAWKYLGEHDEGNHVDEHARGPDEGELPETSRRRHVPEQAQYVGQVVEALAQGRLGDPGVAGLEVEGRLDHLQFGGAHEDLQQDLEPRRPELDARDRLVLYEEEARHAGRWSCAPP